MKRKKAKPIYILRRIYYESWSQELTSNWNHTYEDEYFENLEDLEKSKIEWMADATNHPRDDFRLDKFKIFERYELIEG